MTLDSKPVGTAAWTRHVLKVSVKTPVRSVGTGRTRPECSGVQQLRRFWISAV